MRLIHVRAPSGSYPVVCGAGALRSACSLVRKYTGGGPIFVLSSSRVWKSCEKTTVRALEKSEIDGVILFSDRESEKSLATVQKIARTLIRAGAGRDAILIAVGGGVVGDVAGFVAATYLRGVGLVHIPTTVVAQVDSSVGGKTGVNLPEGKNLVGAFYQPRLVLCDPEMLLTLPDREFRSGIFEIIKYAMLGDAKLFNYLERNLDALSRRSPTVLATVIPRCIRAKAAIVQRDERESGPRELLNLGHTLAHALEAATNYERFLHGEAVGWGLLSAMLAALAFGKMTVTDAARVATLVHRAGNLPSLPAIGPARLWQIIQSDKKARGGEVGWVLPVGIGRAERSVRMPKPLFRRIWAELPSISAEHAR
jgi:3-dehydroquinate synthase